MSPLVAIQKQKKVTSVTIGSWKDLFANAAIMAIIIAEMHVFDVIKLASTCRHLYRFYYGDTSLSNLLREIVLRDTGGKYKKKHPLRYLGVTRNVKRVQQSTPTWSRFMYKANCCASCSRQICTSDCSEVPVKYILCYNCKDRHDMFFYSIWREVQARCRELYLIDCIPRIYRYIWEDLLSFTEKY
jgi:hypothetical protein